MNFVEIPREKGCVVDVYLLNIIGWDLHRVQQTIGFRKFSIETCRSRPPFFWQGDLQRAIFLLALDLGSRLQGSLHSNTITSYATKKSTYTISKEYNASQNWDLESNAFGPRSRSIWKSMLMIVEQVFSNHDHVFANWHGAPLATRHVVFASSREASGVPFQR